MRHTTLAALIATVGFAAVGLGAPGLVPRSVAAADPPITAIAVSPDGDLVAVGSQRGIELYDWELYDGPELQRPRRLDTDLVQVSDLAFSPDGSRLAAGGGSPAVEGTVEVFDVELGERIATASPHADLVYSVSWSDDGKHLATAGGDKSAWVLDGLTLQRRAELVGHSGPVLAIVWLDDDQLVSASADHSLRVWRMDESTPRRTLDHHTQAVLGLAVRPVQADEPGGQLPMVASVSRDHTVRFWQPTIGRLVRFARLPSIPQAVCWARDGRQVAVVCRDGHLRLIDSATAEPTRDHPAVDGVAYSVALTPDDGFLIGGQRGQLSRVPDPR